MGHDLCALCRVELNEETKSKEHIIPNSIGGRKTVNNFICVDCNNKSGTEWDSTLFKQLAIFCTLFNIKKHRGEVKPIVIKTLDGNEYKQFNNGVFQPLRPSISSEKTADGKIKFHYSGSNIKDAKLYLRGMAKKHNFTNNEIAQYEKQLVLKESQMSSPITHEFIFGGAESGRSIVKTGLALTTCLGVNPLVCEKAISYLVNNGEPCFGYYYEKDLIKNREQGLPFHCVYIKAIKSTKQILGYIEYFGHQRIVLCLSTEYEGEDNEITYAIDPILGEEINLEVDLSFSDKEIREIYDYKKYEKEGLEAALGPILGAAVKFSKERHNKRISENAYNYALGFFDSKLNDEENEKIENDKFLEFMRSQPLKF